MNIGTNLHGRLRNTTLPLSHGLSPLFEAVVNSIHALEEANVPFDKGRIRVAIERAPEQTLLQVAEEKRRLPDILNFTVTDNGIGFDDPNFEAFMTLDTERKVAKGGRGIGRLLWLKAFDRATIRSRFLQDGEIKERTFTFGPSGVTDDKVVVIGPDAERETTIRLVGFDRQYRAHTRKTGEAIANALLEHCLWYFVRTGGAPTIVVEDDGENISLDDLYQLHMHSMAVTERTAVKGRSFDLLHVKLRASSAVHSIAFCADNRLVQEEKLAGRIPGLHGRLTDEEGEFVYICYVSSEFLDQHVRPERSAFDIPADVGELFEGTEMSWEDIRAGVAARAAAHLSDYLAEVRERARERVHSFISHNAPRYRPVIGRLSPDELNIDPEISNKDLELTLHRRLAEFENRLISEGHDLLKPTTIESAADYTKRVRKYMQAAEDLKMSDLANYVAHRRVVLDLLALAIQRMPEGGYAREDLIHTLIMPMRTDSTQVLLDNCNLWLVDERLAFHDYLASDVPLSAMPVTGSLSTKEPDLFALNVFDNPILVSEGASLPLASITVVEIKKPMRNDAGPGEKHDPIEQALGYLDRIRKGKVQTATGRPIPRSEAIPGFCYVVSDITPTVETRCRFLDLKRTSDELGYFGFNDSFNAYIEVISFDRLVNAAKQRNRAFFDKLGLPTQ